DFGHFVIKRRPPMDFRDRMMLRYLDTFLAAPEGRAHLLNQVAEAESNGERQIFEHVLGHVDDPQLRRMVQKHQADEVRHEALCRDRLRATGIDPGPVPKHLRLIDRLALATGGLFVEPVKRREDVMKAYLMLQVLEERAVQQFALFEA